MGYSLTSQAIINRNRCKLDYLLVKQVPSRLLFLLLLCLFPLEWGRCSSSSSSVLGELYVQILLFQISNLILLWVKLPLPNLSLNPSLHSLFPRWPNHWSFLSFISRYTFIHNAISVTFTVLLYSRISASLLLSMSMLVFSPFDPGSNPGGSRRTLLRSLRSTGHLTVIFFLLKDRSKTINRINAVHDGIMQCTMFLFSIKLLRFVTTVYSTLGITKKEEEKKKKPHVPFK